MKASCERAGNDEQEDSYGSVGADEISRLAQEAERFAKHVEELRLRVAATVASAERRRASGSFARELRPAQESAGSVEPSAPVKPLSIRPSCLENVSRWLPAPAPLMPSSTSRSGVREKIRAAGRYSFVNPRRGDMSDPVEPQARRRIRVPA